MKLSRVCTKCGAEKPHSSFHKHKGCKDGINSVCKECRKPLSKKSWSSKTTEYKIWSRAKSRAQLKGLDFDLEVEDIVVPDYCPVFKTPMDIPSIDRHDPNKGYTKDNIVIMSNRANVLKNDGTIEEFEKLLEYLKDGGN